MNRSNMDARFFVSTDQREGTFIVPLPRIWWSRPYEYAWCTQFVGEQDIILDAACGISHPFKFYLANLCQREVHACDWDERITSRAAIYADARHDFGEEAANQLLPYIDLPQLHLAHASFTSLPYDDNYFDTIFCISVLEHLSVHDQVAALREFHRKLKRGGKLVLTFDYPTVNLEQLYEHARTVGLVFPDDFNVTLPIDAIRSELWGTLYCFRALLFKGHDHAAPIQD